jgi:hypothetical protein
LWCEECERDDQVCQLLERDPQIMTGNFPAIFF